MNNDAAEMPDVQTFPDFRPVGNVKTIMVFQAPQPKEIKIEQQPVFVAVMLAQPEDDAELDAGNHFEKYVFDERPQPECTHAPITE